jgi:hypothetical protein
MFGSTQRVIDLVVARPHDYCVWCKNLISGISVVEFDRVVGESGTRRAAQSCTWSK